jgi:sugar fermentation stimulation protein A
MEFTTSLLAGKLIKRYKRFLADVELENGEIVTAHCPNTGAMTGCAQAGWKVWLAYQPSPKRKLAYTWELVETSDGHRICINTQQANKLVKEALSQKWLEPLRQYSSIKSEVKYGQQNSRIDFLLDQDGLPDCYVEVKSVTLKKDNGGFFPDAVSVRGQKHLNELIEMKDQGHEAVLLFCVQHSGIESVSPADDIDAEYGKLLRLADQKGVKILAFRSDIATDKMELKDKIPIIF